MSTRTATLAPARAGLNVTDLDRSTRAHAEGAGSAGLFFEDPDGIRLEISAPSAAGAHEAPYGDAPACGFLGGRP